MIVKIICYDIFEGGKDMKILTEEESYNTYLSVEKYIVPNYGRWNIYKKRCNLQCYFNLQTSYLEISIDNHLHYIYVKEKNGKNFYHVFPYQNSYFETLAKDDYSGFDTVIFALFELYHPSLQIKDNVLNI